MDVPRKLSEAEIQDILSVIPNIKSAANEVSQFNTDAMKILVREQLQDIRITPVGIPDLKAEIVRQFRETIITPGSMVGVTAAESLGKNTTQSALNSFHASGSSKNVSGGVERIRELIDASENPKKPSCTMHFKDEFLSFDDIIIHKRPEITQINVQSLVLGMPEIESIDKIVQPFWYSFYRQLVRNDFESKYVLILNIDVNMLYAYKLTMQDIASVIEESGSVICVYSPMSVGRIDIYPIEKRVNSELNSKGIISEDNSSLIFLSSIVVPLLDKLIVSGISGIQQIYPVESPVLQIVKEEMQAEIRQGKQEWYLILNPIRMKITGITVNKLIKLMEIAGVETVLVKEKYIVVQSETSPTEIVKNLIDEDKKEEKVKRKNGTYMEATAIDIHSKLVYADSTGSNFSELLSHPDIDARRTFSNNVHEIKNTLGIEAARNFLIKEFIDVFGAEGYINPRHIVLLADFMTNLGKVYGVTFTGVSRQPIGALEKASYEKAMDVFKEASGFGEKKSVSGTSASVFIGKNALVGTGYSQDYIKPENLERYNTTRKELLEDPMLTLDINNFNEAIEMFNQGGLENITNLENAEEMMFAAYEPDMFSPPAEKPTTISDVSLGDNYLPRGEVLPSSELVQAAGELEEKMASKIVCGLPDKTLGLSITSGGIQKRVVKPRAQPVKIFSLEEFLK